MQRKILLFFFIFVFVFLKNNISDSQETVTLQIAWWGSQVRHEKTLKVINLFEKKYPHVKIQPIYTGWREYWDRMAAYAAGGDLPDIMQHDYKYLITYKDHNLLQEMDKYMNEIIMIKDVDEDLLNSARINNKLYGIPAGLNTYAILYDSTKFKEAGIAEPKYNWTWKEYIEICRKIHKRLGIYAATSLPMATSNITGLEHYVRQHGQSLFAKSSNKLGFTKSLFVQFYQMDLDLTNEGVYTPGELRLENHILENDLIVTDKAVMAAYWTNEIVTISNAAYKSIKMVPFPRAGDQEKSGYYLKPSMYWTITNNSRHPELAAQFIDFLVNDIEANKILNGERGVPISNRVRKAMEEGLDDTEKKMFDFIKYISHNTSIIDPPPGGKYYRVIEILEELHYKILNGSLTPQQAYEELKKRTNTVFSD